MIKSTHTSIFYRNEVVVWRGRGALFWSTALIPVCCFIVLGVTGVSFTHPYRWITGFFWDLVSIRKWAYLICVCIIHWMLVADRIRFYGVVPEIKSSCWSRMQCVLKPRRLLHISSFAIGSGFLCWCLLSISNGSYQSFSYACSGNGGLACFNEQFLFVVLHAMYLGIMGSVIFFSTNQNLIQYPVIQQSKWDQIRGEMLTILINSAFFVFRKMKYFYFFYYIIIGQVVKYWVVSFLPLNINVKDEVDTVYGLLDLYLFMTTWITGTLLYCFSTLFSTIYVAYQTQPYEFVIQSDCEEDDRRKLVEAISCDNYPLLQFQGYKDACIMAKNCASRRSQLFALSMLGGHPYNWLQISTQYLASLSQFCDNVKNHNNKTLLNGSVKRQCEESQPKLSEPHLTTEKESILSKLYKMLLKRKFVAQLFLDTPETSGRQILCQAQKYIWNIEALSHLVTASYKEDKYGVVQKSLPEIVSNLVTLQEEIEKMMKLTSGGSRGGSEQENSMNTRLRVTLKSAIYNIRCVFGSHVESISLSQDVKKRICQFNDYKV